MINYGNTELVYRVNFGDKKECTILINQPHTPIAIIKQEFENLKRLTEIDSRYVIEPYTYFEMKEHGHAFYVAEYIKNASCLGHINDQAGIWDPIPAYHFKNISPEITHKANIQIIALLINYYDEEQEK